jgi:hypothetical protein
MLTLVAGLLPTATVPAIVLGGAASRFIARELRLVAGGVRGAAIGERQRLAGRLLDLAQQGRLSIDFEKIARQDIFVSFSKGSGAAGSTSASSRETPAVCTPGVIAAENAHGKGVYIQTLSGCRM